MQKKRLKQRQDSFVYELSEKPEDRSFWWIFMF